MYACVCVMMTKRLLCLRMLQLQLVCILSTRKTSRLVVVCLLVWMWKLELFCCFVSFGWSEMWNWGWLALVVQVLYQVLFCENHQHHHRHHPHRPSEQYHYIFLCIYGSKILLRTTTLLWSSSKTVVRGGSNCFVVMRCNETRNYGCTLLTLLLPFPIFPSQVVS